MLTWLANKNRQRLVGVRWVKRERPIHRKLRHRCQGVSCTGKSDGVIKISGSENALHYSNGEAIMINSNAAFGKSARYSSLDPLDFTTSWLSKDKDR